MTSLTPRLQVRTTPALLAEPKPKTVVPPSSPERFIRSDYFAAGLVVLVTFGVYFATLAPSVTLEDSGELITGAAAFGVPHPPGYPLWTMSGFLFSHLIPFGNAAWRVNLQSAVFAALANGLLTLLVAHSGRWLLQRWTDHTEQSAVRPYAFYAALLAGFTLGFSDVMWSQAVISEVYTLNALVLMLVLLTFYFWILEPERLDRLLICVFVFALGLTNHHTLIQIIPAFILAAALLKRGQFWSVFLAVNLFSLSVLVYLSWLSDDGILHLISQKMAWGILLTTIAVSLFFLEKFRLKLFLCGAGTGAVIILYGHYVLGPTYGDIAHYTWRNAPHFWSIGSYRQADWLQIKGLFGFLILFTTAAAIGLLYTSKLNRRLVLGVFVAGWVGLFPYGYESIASSTNPPMNWGYTSLPAGFYYAVCRVQYPTNLPNLIKGTFGKILGIVPQDEVTDQSLGVPNYSHRLLLTFYYYGEDLVDNFSAPLVFLPLALILYLRRNDYSQICWLCFLGFAFFTLGFMLHLITPPGSFDRLSTSAYKVFYLQSHCIFALFIGYGTLAGLIFLRELLPPQYVARGTYALGTPALFLSILPLFGNFDDCNQAGHWFGYQYGYDIVQPLEKNAIYIGGTDAGRFVPTYMVFVESQQPKVDKTDPHFDRRDVTVLTQAALCDSYYTLYLRYQYDGHYRPTNLSTFERWLGRDRAYPEPIQLYTNAERDKAWNDFYERHRNHQANDYTTTNEVFEVNADIAKLIFERNKQTHTFYIEQSVPLQWMYPYLQPSGLILRLSKEPMTQLPANLVAEDLIYWDNYSERLLHDPKFLVDEDAQHYYSLLANWHADLYRYRNLAQAEEHLRKIAVALCPFSQEAIPGLSNFYVKENRPDDAFEVIKKGEEADPRNEYFVSLADHVSNLTFFNAEENRVRDEMKKAPLDVNLNLRLAQALEAQDKTGEMLDVLRRTATLTNWTLEMMTPVMQYYEQKVHRPEAALAFLQARTTIDPKNGALWYALVAQQLEVGKIDDALVSVRQVLELGGEDSLHSMQADPHFSMLLHQPKFRDLLKTINLAPPVVPVAPPLKHKL